jgi:hypothetical protein
MTQVKVQETRRKFYNKWLYKISVRNSGAVIFRVLPLESIEDSCNNFYSRRYHHYLKNPQENASLIKIAKVLLSAPKETWSIRVESSTLDIYTNNKDFYNKIGNDLGNRVFRRFEPDTNKLDILNEHRHIAVKKLPHNKYRYKVYLRAHELKSDIHAKAELVKWLKTQDPRIKCTDATAQWFITTHWNWDRRYILVEDEAQLLMLKMRCGNSVGSVYQYVVADK